MLSGPVFHFAAFDRRFLAVRPDYVIEIRPDILEESDGPMLLHGLKERHQQRLMLPTAKQHQPNPDFLEKRYLRFLAAVR